MKLMLRIDKGNEVTTSILSKFPRILKKYIHADTNFQLRILNFCCIFSCIGFMLLRKLYLVIDSTMNIAYSRERIK